MRFIHLADLHIGKKVNEFSMIEDQRFVLQQVFQVIEERQVEGLILAGDIYDKVIPSAEAVQLLDWFLTELAKRRIPVYMVSGNHDSGERLAFGAKLLENSQVYVAAVYDGNVRPIELEDEYGTIDLYLLPFIKPVHVKRALRREEGQEEEITTYQEAVKTVLERVEICQEHRNLLAAHQMVAGASRCDSEEISVGGIDSMDAGLFRDFDYVALGHIHGPQSITRETVRYAGTLLKYSFSECSHQKSITLIDMKEKGNIEIETIAVQPLHDMRCIKGDYNTLMSYDFYKNSEKEDYLKITLTDEEEIPNALGRLRTVYPNIMKLEYDNMRTRRSVQVLETEAAKSRSPIEYFEEFYSLQNNQSMNEKQKQIVSDWIDKVWGDSE